MNTKMYLQLLVALGLIGISFACTCAGTADKGFCEGNFAAIIFVKRGGQDVVDIRVLKTLRGKIPKSDKKLKTKSTNPGCGVTLLARKYYVISGTIHDTRYNTDQPLTTNLCKFRKEFDSESEARSFQVPTCR